MEIYVCNLGYILGGGDPYICVNVYGFKKLGKFTLIKMPRGK